MVLKTDIKQNKNWQLEKKKARVCNQKRIPARPTLLKGIYNYICVSEGYKPVKDVAFALHVVGGRFTSKGINLLGIFRITLKRSIRIEPTKEWLVFLIHEITHQFVYKTRGTTEHDKSFYVVNKHLLNKYVDRIIRSFDETSEEFENLENLTAEGVEEKEYRITNTE